MASKKLLSDRLLSVIVPACTDLGNSIKFSTMTLIVMIGIALVLFIIMALYNWVRDVHAVNYNDQVEREKEHKNIMTILSGPATILVAAALIIGITTHAGWHSSSTKRLAPLCSGLRQAFIRQTVAASNQ
ncbi:OrNVorf41-like-1 [Venturia canescens]|uniref:OrNVorf41-like-1 n=1 Tax=Venturia canescens TaxID=32260 RepID=A0ACB9ZI98_9HYME|nr:uncharacterized LOC122408210 [Venturia canescens]KAI5630592.1 OrNVorf41-like-1 [Venturia canescens]